jgi:hypothetical protein
MHPSNPARYTFIACQFIIVSIAMVVTGGCSPSSQSAESKTEDVAAKWDTARYSDRDVNRAVLRSVVGQRTARARDQIQILEELRNGAVTNAIALLEKHLARDVEQLETIAKNAESTNSFQATIESTLGKFREYRARYPLTP